MPTSESSIQHVSDTALWVAHYRAVESERPDALFRDPFAEILVGERGRKIAESMQATSPYARWTIVIRTRVIDEFIQKLVAEGVDLVINLGAGLDTRPYRMELPASLRWVEVDFPHMIQLKNEKLAAEKPRVRLERIALDLADEGKRDELLSRLAASAQSVLVLTEGVIPYLSEDQVASLAEALRKEKNFRFWITEYFAPEIYRFFRDRKRQRQMRNAPFLFFPTNWFGFFKRHGWKSHEIRYLPLEAQRWHRKMPLPWWARLIIAISPRKERMRHAQRMAYVVMTPTSEH